ncbi:family 10 glycosylhydrolase [Phaeodactylibacter luteus]|uniref:Family 10 glycosylhydrolase n=1 Tax=Phaeodactylibacter luteus TaxID=1564516 RepID=A0A5C6RVF0_9BACT|nr:family 10 glycosylhydrolase [Phaeodactylibacter luteus]TXB66516.1 family 10 glycosylhydrolase [Phaeodactylibacter luteus]
MDKRTFIKTLGQGALGLAGSHWLLQSCSPGQGNTSSEAATPTKVWAWARPQQGWSAEDWKQTLARARVAGVNALLLEVYNGNQTFYEGGQLPMKEDLLAVVAPLCHELGMEFHAWMWTMPLNNPDMVEQHPDWYAVNGLGQPANTHPAYVDYYKFMCPCHPEVQAYVAGNVRSLARISEVDGVHLDYVRLPDVILAKGLQPKYGIVQDREYPEYDYSYSTYCREQFKAQSGIDPLTDLEDPSANEAWRQFRYDSVSNMVNQKLVPEAKAQNKMITAAVFPNWESVRQAWHTWNLDAFLPMLYHNFYEQDIGFIREHTQKALERLNHSKPVYSGLFVPAIAPEELTAAAGEGLEGGASGIALFDLTAMTESHWEQLAALKKS